VGLRFQKRKKLGPLNISLGKKGIGISIGNKWGRVGISSDGKLYTSARIPGTGLSYLKYHKLDKENTRSSARFQRFETVDEFLQEIGIYYVEDAKGKEINFKPLLQKFKYPFLIRGSKPLFWTYILLTFVSLIIALAEPIIGLPLFGFTSYISYYLFKVRKHCRLLPQKGIKGTLFFGNKKYLASIEENNGKCTLTYVSNGNIIKTNVDCQAVILKSFLGKYKGIVVDVNRELGIFTKEIWL